MASADLLRSWQRTEALLADARSHLPEEALHEFQEKIAEYTEFIEHNELGLACDTLEYIAMEVEQCPKTVFELLACAAENMGLHDQKHRLEKRLLNPQAPNGLSQK
jgi:hypothetical protein